MAFLGPEGTFTEEALRKTGYYKDLTLTGYPDIAEILSAVDRGEAEKGIVPIENSIEGSVNITLDQMIFKTDVLIEKEIVLNVDHNLLSKNKTGISDIKEIYTHPHAAAQCHDYIKGNLPQAVIKATNSTAEAARIVASDGNDIAAISTKLAAKLYGLEIMATDIQDIKENSTRFVIVGKEQPPRTGDDKTSVVLFIHEDRPGSLLEILQEFAGRGINLTKIESRPTKKTLGEYCFLVDMQGHIEDDNVGGAIGVLKNKLRDVKFLGSFPRWKE